MSHEDVEMARRGIEFFNRGDREALVEMASPDIEIVPLRAALEGTVFRGPDAYERFWEAVDESWEWVRIEPEEFVDAEPRVLVTGRLRARAKDTEMEVDSPIAFVFEAAGGKLTSLRTYPDLAEARRAAGLAD